MEYKYVTWIGTLIYVEKEDLTEDKACYVKGREEMKYSWSAPSQVLANALLFVRLTCTLYTLLYLAGRSSE